MSGACCACDLLGAVGPTFWTCGTSSLLGSGPQVWATKLGPGPSGWSLIWAHFSWVRTH